MQHKTKLNQTKPNFYRVSTVKLSTNQLIDANHFSQFLIDDVQHLDEFDVELEFADIAPLDFDEFDVELEFAGIAPLDFDENDYLFEPCMYHAYLYQ